MTDLDSFSPPVSTGGVEAVPRPASPRWPSALQLKLQLLWSVVLKGVARFVFVNGILRPWWFVTGRYPRYTRRGMLAVDNLTTVLRRAGMITPATRVGAASAVPIAPGVTATVWRVTVHYEPTASTTPSAATRSPSWPDIPDPHFTSSSAPPTTFVLKEYNMTLKAMLMGAAMGLPALEVRWLSLLSHPTKGESSTPAYARDDQRALGDGLLPLTIDTALSPCRGIACLLLEDLGHLRSHPFRLNAPIPMTDIEAMFDAVGVLHGRSWNHRRVAAAFRSESRSVAFEDLFIAAFRGIEKLIERTSPSSPFQRLLASIPSLRRAQQRLAAPEGYGSYLTWCMGTRLHATPSERVTCFSRPFVLTHGDCRFDNAFLVDIPTHAAASAVPSSDDAPRCRARLIDWQAAAVTHPGRDLVWLLQEVPTELVCHSVEGPTGGPTKDSPALDTMLRAYLRGARRGFAEQQMHTDRFDNDGSHRDDGSPTPHDVNIDVIKREWLPRALASSVTLWTVALRHVIADVADKPNHPSRSGLLRYLGRVEALIEHFGFPESRW